MILEDNPPVASLLKQLTADQKWQAFQLLWQDVVKDHAEEIEPPAWHENVLRERLEKIKSGKAVWHDLDQAFDDLRKELA
ncbi:addiction module protein [Prosthecobacter fluviatilis]|uniref:Addiction module protein n=1 Tax=Prosthecobacter fluviatilis TaxID=445931 RepID=A0ABW0KLD7_9BACT